jgi:RNA polymerase sigma-70 factor (ECF subfamily)
MDMQDIEYVVHRCQQGQLDAFNALFSHYQVQVYDLACIIMRDDKAAEGVVQDTFLMVFQKIDSYKGEARFDTWLTAVAVNQCRMRLRKRKIRQALSLEQLTPDRLFRLAGRGDDVSEIVHQRQRRQTLWDMVDQLNDRLRLPMILRYRYALSCGDIAFVLDRRKPTIYQQLNQGRRRLENMIQQQEAEIKVTLAEIR